MQHTLQDISQMDISYLSNLDYIDISNLCNTSKRYMKVCNDNIILRNLIYARNDEVDITPNFNIARALKDIYNTITEIIDVNYPEEILPKWVNKEIFKDDMMKKVRADFVYNLADDIFNSYIDNNEYIIRNVKISKSILAFPLYLPAIDEIDIDVEQLNIPNTIIMPQSFIEYIIPTLNKVVKFVLYDDEPGGFYNTDNDELIEILSDMLLINERNSIDL